jgi:hypothetical protein
MTILLFHIISARSSKQPARHWADMGLEVPVLASLPLRNQRAPALCGCKKHGMDLFGDHTSTCTAHSGATKAHDWAVGVLGPDDDVFLFVLAESKNTLPDSWTHGSALSTR